MNKQCIKSRYLSYQSNELQTLFILNHPLFSASISRFGGQLLSFIPTGADELIWVSDSAIMNGSKPIRGGAPICWPWFGPSSGQFSGEPQHGYARSVNWEIESLIESEVEVKVTLVPNFGEDVKKKLQLSLSVEYTFSQSASIAVTTKNNGKKEFELSLAIHTYLNMPNSTNIEIPALNYCQYFDKLNDKLMTQSTPFEVKEAMDRVYLYDSPNILVNGQNRVIEIQSNNQDSMVIWTPWQQGAAEMSDFDDSGYLSMLCIETALTQGFKLPPGHKHTLTQQLSIVSSS